MLAFMNSGQACPAGTRHLVPKSRFDAGKRAILDTMASFPVGDPADPKTAVGPMVSQNQYDRVQSYRISTPRKLIIVSSCFLKLITRKPQVGVPVQTGVALCAIELPVL
jgi:acyl-CoA reductase-like NAD-dependent aldehyde dehydrogenase